MNKAGIILLALLFAFPAISRAVEQTEWNTFKDRFISVDGRVIDYVNGQISTSEGQAYTMLVAVKVGDRRTFDMVWKWAKDNLQIRSIDKLMAWKWGERATGEWSIIDMNNATDGDIITALALFEASGKWGNDNYRKEAQAIMTSVREKLITERGGKLLTMPGHYGFSRDDDMIINPSYLIVSAYKNFARYSEDDVWNKLYNDSLFIIGNSTFGKFSLPADWVLWSRKGPRVYSERSDLFGYEAVRVLLYLSWDKKTGLLRGLDAYLDFVRGIGFLPLTVDLSRDAISLNDAPGGFYAVFARAAGDLGKKGLSEHLWTKSREKIRHEKEDYYSNILYLLSNIDITQ